MRTSFQIMTTIFLGLFFIWLGMQFTSDDLHTETKETDYFQRGDEFIFSETQPMTLEAVDEEPFTFIAEDQVIKGTPFANQYKADVIFTSSSLHLVEGSASIVLYPRSNESFDYVIYRGTSTIISISSALFFIWLISSAVTLFLISLVTPK